MKTRKGGNLITQTARSFGLYHEPSTSKLMRNFLEIYGQPYVNVHPILKEWVVEKVVQGKRVLLLDSRYEAIFLEMYCKVFTTFIQPFSVIYDFKSKVEKYSKDKKQEYTSALETLTIYVQKYIKQEKKIPANAYDWLMDWIDYMETFKPSAELSNLKKSMIGNRSDQEDPRWNSIFILPKAPVRTGGDPDKKDPIHISPDPIVIEIFLNIIIFVVKLLLVLLSGGIVNPF